MAVIGVGNVGLDVARMLARTAEELLSTDIPPHVHEVLADSAVTDVHMFARRGPAQAKFTPVELRELDHSPNVQVVVGPEGMEFDAESQASLSRSKSLADGRRRAQRLGHARTEPGPHRRIHIHFLENPVEVLGADGGVVGLRTERQELTGDGNVRGTGEFTDWDVQAVYRAVGYRSEAIEDLPFDTRRFVLPNDGGRVHRPGRRPAARHLRHRLGQARAGRPHRAHQVRRGRDHREPAGRRAGPVAGAAPGSGRQSTPC